MHTAVRIYTPQDICINLNGGCKNNDHTAWAIVEAETANDARQMAPWYLRETARIVRLVKFDLANDKLDLE